MAAVPDRIEKPGMVACVMSRGMRRAEWLLGVALISMLSHFAWGGEAMPTEQDPVHEKRAVQLAEQLRCLVCQNQSLAESSAELAVDLRRQIRDQLREGKSDREIVDFMVQRYGDFVLYQPPLKARTLLLWGGPPMLLLIGAVVLIRNLRERRKRVADRELTGEERERAATLLAGGSKERP
jgi:cytochrome c-type biogenesis protein CcmH